MLRMPDGDTRSWQITTLFGRVAIDRKCDKVRTDAAVVQEGVSLRWRAVRGNALAVLPGRDEEPPQTLAAPVDGFAERGVRGKVSQSRRPLTLPQRCDSRLRWLRTIMSVAHEEPKRAAVCWQLFDIEHGQLVCSKHVLDREQ